MAIPMTFSQIASALGEHSVPVYATISDAWAWTEMLRTELIDLLRETSHNDIADKLQETFATMDKVVNPIETLLKTSTKLEEIVLPSLLEPHEWKMEMVKGLGQLWLQKNAERVTNAREEERRILRERAEKAKEKLKGKIKIHGIEINDRKEQARKAEEWMKSADEKNLFDLVPPGLAARVRELAHKSKKTKRSLEESHKLRLETSPSFAWSILVSLLGCLLPNLPSDIQKIMEKVKEFADQIPYESDAKLGEFPEEGDLEAIDFADLNYHQFEVIRAVKQFVEERGRSESIFIFNYEICTTKDCNDLDAYRLCLCSLLDLMHRE